MSIEELKNLQSKIIKKNKICNTIGAITLIIIAIIILLKINKVGSSILFVLPFIIVFFIIIFIIVKTIVNGKDIKRFNQKYKNVFVLRTLQKNLTDVVYNSEKGFEKERIEEIEMIYTGDRYTSNDYVSGTYKNTKFEQADIKIEEEHEYTDSDGKKREEWITIFNGRLFIFDFNKEFKANMQIANSKFSADILPWKKKFSKVKMEDVEFNKMFSIYAENEHEAFYILTPHFMEKLKNISKRLNCGIMFCFVNNKLYIALDDGEDAFEYNVLKPINEEEIENNIMKDIKIITDFVDELHLDSDLFGKEV